MTIAEAWMAGREHLMALGIDEAGITAEVLLRHALTLDRSALYLAWNKPIGESAWTGFQRLLEERARGRPVAYITGHREFLGLEFAVDERVLIPRPETEVLVETVLDVVRDVASPVIADVGTGSGAIAVSLAALRPDAVVMATDISSDALQVARTNAVRHGVVDRIRFLQGDWLHPLRAAAARLDALACNPPYVTAEAAATLPREIREYEPALAVVAPGPADDAVYARLIDEAPGVLASGGWLAVEVAAGQATRIVELLMQSGRFAVPHARRDGLGWERVVAAQILGPTRES